MGTLSCIESQKLSQVEEEARIIAGPLVVGLPLVACIATDDECLLLCPIRVLSLYLHENDAWPALTIAASLLLED